MPSVDVLARRVADAAVAWLTDPRDQQAYGRLVEAVEAYRSWRQPMLELDVVQAVARLARVADTAAVGELLRTDPDFRAAIERLQRHTAGPTLDDSTAGPDETGDVTRPDQASSSSACIRSSAQSRESASVRDCIV